MPLQAAAWSESILGDGECILVPCPQAEGMFGLSLRLVLGRPTRASGLTATVSVGGTNSYGSPSGTPQ